jgi:hypothetical protein
MRPEEHGAVFSKLTTLSHKVGTGNVSVAQEVAEVQKLLKASGLYYTLHSAGTTVGMFIHETMFAPGTLGIHWYKQRAAGTMS